MSAPRLLIGLSAVMVALKDGEPNVLVTRRPSGEDALLFGPFDPANHRTFDLSLRGWVREQTGFEIGYVEQLYTFGDKDRETPEASLMDANAESRVISVGYLALTPEARPAGASFEARWQDWYHYFPWEDHRVRRPPVIEAQIEPRLKTWAPPATIIASTVGTGGQNLAAVTTSPYLLQPHRHSAIWSSTRRRAKRTSASSRSRM
jgi:hypothetical protein